MHRYWELNVAARRSDYSTSGAEVTYKVSSLYQPAESPSLRGSLSTGFRAPGTGELFGGAAREDFTFVDPRSDVLGEVGSSRGGRDAAQPARIIANCANLGVPVGFVQSNPQLSAVSAGNASLSAETSESFTVGVVWRADFDRRWIARLSASVDYYGVEIADAVQGRSPADVLAACVDTLDPAFCDLARRTSNGALDVVDNQLQNIGGIEAAGFDVRVTYAAPAWPIGQISATFDATFLADYTERTRNVDGTESVMERAGTHTNETFQRAFPELRWTATVDWLKDRWDGALGLRWTDSLTLAGGGEVAPALYTDISLGYTPGLNRNWTAIVDFNNVLDEDPPLCFPCGVVGMSTVVHDLPGRVGYPRIAYRP